MFFLPFSYARTAYCDVTGRESRLPLRIRGDGVGPRVHFSLDTLDIGNVFINSQHSYEVNIDIIVLLLIYENNFVQDRLALSSLTLIKIS